MEDGDEMSDRADWRPSQKELDSLGVGFGNGACGQPCLLQAEKLLFSSTEPGKLERTPGGSQYSGAISLAIMF